MQKLFGVLSIPLLLIAVALQAAEVNNLRYDYTQNSKGTNGPVGVDDTQPQLSWIVTSSERGDVQSAYQVLVASSPELLAKDQGDVWDSGQVSSGQSTYVAYRGKPLASGEQYFWKVRVWDKDGKASEWSPGASWAMGLLDPKDWTAEWITPSKWFTPPQYRAPGLILGANGGWADIDLGKDYPIDSIKLYLGDPSKFPTRFKLLGSDNIQFNHATTFVDETQHDYVQNTNGTGGVQEFPLNGQKARLIRLWITGSPNNQDSNVRQMEVMSHGTNVALMKFSRAYGSEWYRGNAVSLVDGMPSRGDGDSCPSNAISTAAAPLLRKSFVINKEVKRATLYLAALGMADVKVNGKKVGDEVLGPPFSDSSKRVIYVTHDITPLLAQGENVLGVTLGNGFFSPPGRGAAARNGDEGPPQLLLQADIEYTDGTKEVVNSDRTWRWSKGAITSDDLWVEYVEDRRQDKLGWDLPGYKETNATDWQGVTDAPPPEGNLIAPMAPPIRILDEIKPVSIDGNHAHFAALSSGWPKIKVNGHAGETIWVDGSSSDFRLPRLLFTLDKDGPTVLEPRFMVMTGPTDIQVNGNTEPLPPDAISIDHINADLPLRSSFTSSSPWLNHLYEVTLRTHRNYVYDVPGDPSREKQGWTQDAQGFFDTAAYLTDVSGLYHRWWWDWADNQDDQGYTGSVSPLVKRQDYQWNSPWWSGVIVFLPWEHYQYYGNLRMLQEAYEPMRRYVDFLGNMAAAGYDADTGNHWADYPYLTENLNSEVAKKKWIVWNGAGDWMNPDFPGNQHVVPTPMMTMPAWYYYAKVVSQSAALLGNQADATKYAAIAEDVKKRFNNDFFHPESGMYGDETNNETAQILPVALGMVPTGKEQLAYERLLDTIHARNDHIGTGFVSLPWLLQTLAWHRESALANKMVNQKDFPSWNTLITEGVLKEGWEGGNAQMPSTGGSIAGWLFRSVLGIQPDPTGPGFKKFILSPQPDPATQLTSASGYYDSIYGRIGSDWKLEDGKFSLKASIPVNSTATVVIPTSNPNSVIESGLPAAQAPGVKFLRAGGTGKNQIAIYQVTSGVYNFAATQAL